MRRRFGPGFPACAGRLIPILRIIVPVHIPLLLRPLPGADILVDFCHLFHWEPLAEMHHHRRIEQPLRLELMQAQKILHIAVFLELLYRPLVCEVAELLDEDRAKSNSGWDGRAARFLAQILCVDIFDVLPGHDARQTYPSIVFAQSTAKRLKKFFHRQLFAIVPVIHPLYPHIQGFFPKTPLFGLLYDTTLLNLFQLFLPCFSLLNSYFSLF